VDFSVDLLGRRERRALLLMAAALVTVLVTSIMYLHPATAAGAASARIVSAAPPTHTSFQPVVYEVLPGTGRPTGGYFIWNVALRGGAGGHRVG
jgi:hypothetical protein